jgi:hypothetical protein
MNQEHEKSLMVKVKQGYLIDGMQDVPQREWNHRIFDMGYGPNGTSGASMAGFDLSSLKAKIKDS